METTEMEKPEKVSKKDIQVRLRRIEGQVKGIENMIEKGSCCKDVLVQIAAIRAAINKVGILVLENYAKDCIFCGDEQRSDAEKLEELVSTLSMFLK